MIYIDAKTIKKVMESFTIVIDTREQMNDGLKNRIAAFPCPVERAKLSFGDYTAYVVLPDGSRFSLADKMVIERKMDLAEICANYTNGRERFIREFERATECGAKVAILIQDATWDKAYGGIYNSKMTPAALTASLTTWLARYNCSINFCKEPTVPKLIYDILYREMKERLLTVEVAQIESE